MEKDWRLTNQMNYLYRVTLKKTIFQRSEANDHEHCEFCWAKFGESDGLQKSGYCTLDRYHWICNACFQDFQEQFEWKQEDDGLRPGQGDGSAVSTQTDEIDPK